MLNQGVSFGLFQGIPVWVIVLIWLLLFLYAVLPAVPSAQARQAGKMRELWGRVGVGLILMGGAGNIISRIVYGGVMDNLNLFGVLHNNVWDYLIFAGVVIFIWKNIFLSHD
ncbi:signal peptidase II [Candidatus Woesebacteria bacterium]|nr:signal peptidase II [Candidatus Woesebacteria bacterium]